MKYLKVILDLLLRKKSNLSLQILLPLRMWACNHALQCWSNKNPEEKDRILNLAHKKNQDMKEKYQGRAEALKPKKKEKTLEKLKEKQEILEIQSKKKADALIILFC